MSRQASDGGGPLARPGLLGKLKARLLAVVTRRDIEREIDDELRFHLEMQAQANLEAGMAPAPAARAARLSLGSVEGTKEAVRDVRSVWLDDVWQDIRYGLRMLRRNPGVTALVVVALGLGIGVNSAVFSVVNMLFLRPLPVPNAESLVVPANTAGPGQDAQALSWLDITDLRETTVFEDVTGYLPDLGGLSDGDRAERVTLCYVPSNYFSLLGVEPALGQLFRPGEGGLEGHDPVVVLGHSYWKSRFGADPGVLGKTVHVGGRPVTVMGVSAEGFHGTYAFLEMQAYLPLGWATHQKMFRDLLTNRGERNMHGLARLRPGLSIEQARAALEVVAERLASQYPETNEDRGLRLFWETQARPEEENAEGGPVVASVFLGLVAVVLLVALVNVANVLLVRASVRRKELAVRAALGAARGRIVRQLLTESVLLALLGGGLGVLLGRWTSRALAGLLPSGDLPMYVDLSFDWRVFAYIAAIALLSGLAAGLVPALRVSRFDLSGSLSLGGRARGGAAGGQRLRDLLVSAQVAGSLLLLVAAGLFIRSLMSAAHVDLGFRPDQVMNFCLDPGQQGLDQATTESLYDRLRERAASLPGVESVSLAYSIPLGYYNVGTRIVAEGQPLAPDEKGLGTSYNVVDTAYRRTMGLTLTRGRWFTDVEDHDGQAVAVVNEHLAGRLWPGQDPLGRRFRRHRGESPSYEVVGVVRNGKYNYLFEDPSPYFFIPHGQDYQSLRALHVRSPLDPASVAASVRQILVELAPNVPVYDVMTMRQALGGGNGFFLVRLGAGLAALLGVLGACLALVGLYGVVAYTAGERTQEIGLRVALGAGRRQVVGMVARQGLRLALLGGAVGLVGALALTRLMAWMLLDVHPYDPLTYIGVCVVLAVVALAACVVPASRALAVDPAVALRCE